MWLHLELNDGRAISLEVMRAHLSLVIWEEFELTLKEVDKILMAVSFATCLLNPPLPCWLRSRSGTRLSPSGD